MENPKQAQDGGGTYRSATTDALFLGFGQEPDPNFVHWRDAAVNEEEMETRPVPSFDPQTQLSGMSLVIVRGEKLGKKLPLPLAGLTVGRSPHCEIVVGKSGDGTSRRHARLFFEAGALTVEDLGSTNGLLVNRRRCSRSVLHSGDLLQIGATVFQVQSKGADTHRHAMVPATALEDPLTGGFSWQRCEAELLKTVPDLKTRTDPCCALLVHIDYFRAFHQTHGDAATNQVHGQVARLIAATLRAADFSCVFSRDRFIAVIPDVDTRGVEEVARSLCRLVADFRFVINGAPRPQTVSVAYVALDLKLLSLQDTIDGIRRWIPQALSRGGNQALEADLSQAQKQTPAHEKTVVIEAPPSDSALDRLLKASEDAGVLFASDHDADVFELPQPSTEKPSETSSNRPPTLF